MPPAGLAILLGAGPTTGAGLARVLARASQGNLAVALLSRSGDASLADRISKESDGGVLKAFKTDTSETSLKSAFDEVKQWATSIDKELKLNLAIWSIKRKLSYPSKPAPAGPDFSPKRSGPVCSLLQFRLRLLVIPGQVLTCM
jgi:NAD(P)-dependent dehydrogenase (short-subunit alcohol dehydrogenase family)